MENTLIDLSEYYNSDYSKTEFESSNSEIESKSSDSEVVDISSPVISRMIQDNSRAIKIIKAKVGMQKINCYLKPGFLRISIYTDKLLKKIDGKINRKLTPEEKDSKFIREEATIPLGLFYSQKYNDDDLQMYIPEIVTDTEDIWIRTILHIKDLNAKKGGRVIVSINKKDIHDLYKLLSGKSKDSDTSNSNTSFNSNTLNSNSSNSFTSSSEIEVTHTHKTRAIKKCPILKHKVKAKKVTKAENSIILKRLICKLSFDITRISEIREKKRLHRQSAQEVEGSKNFFDLYLKISKAEEQNKNAHHDVIKSYYNFEEELEKRLTQYREANEKHEALKKLYDEVRDQLPKEVTKNALRKKYINFPPMTTTYFDTPSEEWSFIGYYKHRRNESNFTFSFRKESFLLKKYLESHQEKIPRAKQLAEAFKNHRQHNEEVNIFWNEIEHTCLEQEGTLRTLRCHVNIRSKTQDMMENMAEETVEEAELKNASKRLHSEFSRCEQNEIRTSNRMSPNESRSTIRDSKIMLEAFDENVASDLKEKAQRSTTPFLPKKRARNTQQEAEKDVTDEDLANSVIDASNTFGKVEFPSYYSKLKSIWNNQDATNYHVIDLGDKDTLYQVHDLLDEDELKALFKRLMLDDEDMHINEKARKYIELFDQIMEEENLEDICDDEVVDEVAGSDLVDENNEETKNMEGDNEKFNKSIAKMKEIVHQLDGLPEKYHYLSNTFPMSAQYYDQSKMSDMFIVKSVSSHLDTIIKMNGAMKNTPERTWTAHVLAYLFFVTFCFIDSLHYFSCDRSISTKIDVQENGFKADGVLEFFERPMQIPLFLLEVSEGPNNPDPDKINEDRQKLMNEGVFAINKFMTRTGLPTWEVCSTLKVFLAQGFASSTKDIPQPIDSRSEGTNVPEEMIIPDEIEHSPAKSESLTELEESEIQCSASPSATSLPQDDISKQIKEIDRDSDLSEVKIQVSVPDDSWSRDAIASKDSNYKYNFEDSFDNNKDDSQSENANASKDNDRFCGFFDNDDKDYYYDLNTSKTCIKSEYRYSIRAY
ncbi:7049_t:CDS:10 [Ambispora leptoticha]|uniref:7049_t:CDS:1 n=1 Tax=Ambispora leptoticha TaxID=144679 RepID=A0A9N9A1J8_9GLOM|nr:7049_t:CDS:10 [Ambispora leptoticha]